MLNKKLNLMVLFSLALLFSANSWAQTEQPKLTIPRTNPPGRVKQLVGATEVEVDYNRPSVKGRQIFGALVPYGQVWRTGADSATKISFSTPVKINGADVPAGTYELFTIPNPDEWTVIIHQNMSQWGSYAYDQANDVVRVTAKPETLARTIESFTIGVGDLKTNSATLYLAWDKVLVPVQIEVDVVAQVVPQIEAVMSSDAEKKPYFLAAMFYYENDIDLDKAAEWMAAALEQNPGHIGMLHRQALILAKKGDKEGALAAARASLAGAADVNRELREEYIRLNTALIEKLEQQP
jgi:Protein of unknown function (DUF2911)